jgi:RNA polymerase sigma factor (sigma-70 family)
MDLAQALTALTPRQRRAVLLYAQGFTQCEIAQTIGVSQQAIGKTLENAFSRMNMLYFA